MSMEIEISKYNINQYSKFNQFSKYDFSKFKLKEILEFHIRSINLQYQALILEMRNYSGQVN